MWKKKLVWKNDSIEFDFKDNVVFLEESIQDDELRLKATMKNGNQIKQVELRMTISEENNNPLKAEMQEYYEQGTVLNPLKLQLADDESKYAHMEASASTQPQSSSTAFPLQESASASVKKRMSLADYKKRKLSQVILLLIHFRLKGHL